MSEPPIEPDSSNSENTQYGFAVIKPGVHSLLQDKGRFGQHRIGLTNGGPLDLEAFIWANRLVGNSGDAAALEVSVGGLQLQAKQEAVIAVAGAEMPLTVNGNPLELWASHSIKAGDTIEFGFARNGLRAYLAVAGGFQVPHMFGSCATVVRETVGGIDGKALQEGDWLACKQQSNIDSLTGRAVVPEYRPAYQSSVRLRVIPGYQQKLFHWQQQRLFYGSEFTVSNQADRMGYRLNGPAIHCEVDGVLSEGICLGAIQFPPDGQPIVLLNDRQTIGGYPKIGSVLSLDLSKLAQLPAGGRVSFEAISLSHAQQLLRDQARMFDSLGAQ